MSQNSYTCYSTCIPLPHTKGMGMLLGRSNFQVVWATSGPYYQSLTLFLQHEATKNIAMPTPFPLKGYKSITALFRDAL